MLLNALWIVLLGMAIVFAVLVVLMVVMMLLDKVVRTREEKKS